MRLKSHQIWLIAIFVAVLSFRLAFAFSTPHFSDDGSYFVLRQVEHITQTGLPLYNDPLSYSGRVLFFSPFFHYVLAFFNLFLPVTIVGKLIPNLLASLIVIASYLTMLEITKQKKAALITAFIAGFLPIFIRETVNTISLFSLLVPLLLFSVYMLLKLRTYKKYVAYLIVVLSIFIITDNMSMVLILGLIFYFLLTRTEDIAQNKSELEIILFSCFLFFWVNFIIFKKAFLLYGPAVIWQNIPNVLLSNFFSQISILEGIYAIGILPFIFGIFIIYDYIFKHKSRSIYMLISIALSSFILFWFRLIPVVHGLILTGTMLVLLSGQYAKSFIVYINKSKFSKTLNIILVAIVFLVVVTSVIPSFMYANNSVKNALSEKDIKALGWLKANTPEDAVILTNINEGHLITYFSQRKNVADSNFLLISNINQRINDMRIIYTTPYKIDAVRLLNKYGIDYIYLSPSTKDFYSVEQLIYATEDCFRPVYNESILIYKSLCRIEENI